MLSANELISIREHHRQVFFILKREEEAAWVYKTALAIFEVLFWFQDMTNCTPNS